jgi:hypothetical protein
MLSMAILAFSCKKKKDPPTYCEEHPSECASISEAKEFFLFKPGSWWVYQEETSLVRDSLYVIGYANSEGYNFDARYFSPSTGFTYNFFPEAYSGGVSGCNDKKLINTKCLYISKSKSKPQPDYFLAQNCCFYLYYQKGSSISNSSEMTNCETNRLKVEEIYQNYIIFTNSFQKTVKISEDCNYSEGSQPTNHYYAKGVGLIRKELIDSNQVWNLVNYHIEP